MKKLSTLSFKKDGPVGFIYINQLVASKALEMHMPDELSEICCEISFDESIVVLIITGVGEKAFSFDITNKELALVKKYTSSGLLPSISEPIASLAIPIIAAINGDAIGNGLELALACDFRIIVENARLGFPQILSGIMPYDGGTQRLPRLVSRGKAIEMLLTGALIDAKEAYRVGLVNRLVDNKELISVAMDMAQSLATKGPLALKYAKEAVLKGMDLTLDQGLRLETDLYCLLQTTVDRIEGIEAFREKRRPTFKGT